MVFGGFNGSFLDDCFVFDHETKTMVKAGYPCPTTLFCYQMPSVADKQNGNIITVDWQSKAAYMLK